MPNYETQYIARGASAEEVVEAFGALLTKLNSIMNNLDSGNVRRISTNQTSIKSDDGSTEINGSQIIMYDKDGTERVNIGKDKNGSFNFILKDADGDAALTLSDKGKAVFRGQINAKTDVTVGKNIYLLGTNDKDDIKKIQFFDQDNETGVTTMYISATQENGILLKGNTRVNGKLQKSDGEGGYSDVITKKTSAYVEIEGNRYNVIWG